MLKTSVNKFLFDLAKEKPLYLFASLILSFSTAILNVVSTILLIPVLIICLGKKEGIIVSDQLAIVQYFFGFMEQFYGENKLVIFLIFVVILIILKNITNYISTIIGIKYIKYLVYRIKSQGLSLLCKVNINYYNENKVGDILFKINREIDRTALTIKNGQNIFILSIIIFTFVFLLLLISWSLTLIASILFGLTTIINQFLIYNSKKLSVLLSQQTKIYSQKIIDFFTGIHLIKSAANETQEYQVITQIITEKDQMQLNNQVASAIISPVNEVLGMIVILVLIIISNYLYNRPIQNYAPSLLIYLVILFRLLPFIRQFNNARIQFATNIYSAEIIANFLDEANKPILSSGKITFSKLQSGIKFKTVTFAYPNHAKLVLDKIDLWIPREKTIALVGKPRSGKSTIVELLSRFYDPIDGDILIDDRNLKEYNLASLRRSISVINQDIFLFNNSIAYNIAYGLKNVSEFDIINAAKKANAEEFISQLPQGLATEIGDRGMLLTLGQRQRIAIARAFLRNPDILILDEVTDALDEANEKLVQDAIEELCHNRTTLIITNRLSTIKHAHQIIVLNKGKVIEVGTHEELLQNNNLYSRWYSMQFKTSQQSHQQKLAKKISKKLARQTNRNLSAEISNNLNSLLNYLELVNEGFIEDDLEQEKILDESYQSAKNMLVSLREYERKISQSFRNSNL